MSTKSRIYYECEDGSFKGVYCHYDGYPSHVYPILYNASWEYVVKMVDEALANSGLRCLSDDSYEVFRDGGGGDDSWGVKEWPPCSAALEYNYLKRRDGSVECIDYRANHVDCEVHGAA